MKFSSDIWSLKTIVLAKKLVSVWMTDSKEINFLTKKVWKILWENFDIHSVINNFKREKNIILRTIRKNKEENDKYNAIFDYIESVFLKCGYEIKLTSLYYNFNKINHQEFIDIFSRWLNADEKNEEIRLLKSNKNSLDENRIFVPIYDILSSDNIKWYIVAKTKLYDKKKIFFISNVIFELLENVINDMFIYKYENLIQDSIIDSLTWWFRREYGLWKIENDVNNLWENNNLYLMFVDIDHFKKFNDTYGHDIWDKVLKIFVTAISNVIRSSDYIVRYGWEEFLVVFKTFKNREHIITNRVKQEIDENIKILIEQNNIPENITFSGWVSSAFSIHMDDILEKIEAMITLADANMYKAKNNWRNQIRLDNWKIIK